MSENYLVQDCDISLKSALDRYYAQNPGFYQPSQLDDDSCRLFFAHDVCHIVFGCDTSLVGEAKVEQWTLHSTNFNFKEYVDTILSTEATRQAVPEISPFKLLVQGVLNVFPLIKTYLSARQVQPKWNFMIMVVISIAAFQISAKSLIFKLFRNNLCDYYKMENKSFDAIYPNVPRDRVDELLEFRSTHPVQQRSIDGVEWQYIFSGTGSETILIMGGPLSTPEMHYRSILNLEQDYRVLSLSYAVFGRVDNFLDGLAKLLDSESIERFNLWGTSLGAGICHVLMRRQAISGIYPLKNRVDRLILSTFGLYSSKKISQLKILIWLFRLLPYGITSKYINFTMSTSLKRIDNFDPSFHLAHTKDIINYQNNKQTLIGQYQMVVDIFENSNYNLEQEIESFDVLIIETQDEESLDFSEKTAFRQTYLDAHIHCFKSGGHLREITHQDEYPAIIREFLTRSIK